MVKLGIKDVTTVRQKNKERSLSARAKPPNLKDSTPDFSLSFLGIRLRGCFQVFQWIKGVE